MAKKAASDKKIVISDDGQGKPTAGDVTIKKARRLVWELDKDAEKKWDLVSIEWKDEKGPNSGDFVDWGRPKTKSGKRIRVQDKCSQAEEYGYRIWVVCASGLGAPIASDDPTIRNIPPRAPQ